MTRAFDVTTAERAELTRLHDTAPQAYLRERAAALLKVADGMSAARVACQGLLRPRKPDTVYSWIDGFIDEGSASLHMRAGRGRKSALPPRYATPETTAQELRQTVNRLPCAYGQSGTRWTLATLLLERLRITWQHARSYMHSPDLDYDAKLANVQAVRMLVEQAPGQVAVVYLDEVTIEQQPSPGIVWRGTACAA
jgi:transposase